MKRYLLLITLLSFLSLFNSNVALASSDVIIEKIGSIDVSDKSQNDVAIQGNYAYIVSSYRGLYVVDISNKNNPSLIANILNPNQYNYEAIEISGNYAYIAQGSHGLEIVDISNPYSPVTVGEFKDDEINFYVRDIAVKGDFVYMVGDTNYIEVVDISDPYKPTLYERIEQLGLSGNKIKMIDNQFYSAEDYLGLYSANIKTDGILEEIFPYPTQAMCSGYCYTVGASENFVAMPSKSSGGENIKLVIAKTNSITSNGVGDFIELQLESSYLQDIEISGDYLYLTTNDNKLEIFDLTKYSSSVSLSEIRVLSQEIPAYAYKVKVVDDYVYILHGKAGLEIYKLTTQTQNSAPVLSPIGDKSVNEDELLEFTISATDSDGDSLTYWSSSLPSGAYFDPITQKFNWTPSYEQSGEYELTFSVTDGNLSDSETITVTVDNNIAGDYVWQSCELELPDLNGPYSYNQFMGYKFKPDQNGQVTELCAHINGTEDVKLQNSSFDVLASVSVTASGDWNCASIPPININKNSYYYVGVDLNGSGGYYRSGNTNYLEGVPSSCGNVYIASSCYQATTSKFTSPFCVQHQMYGMADIKFIVGTSDNSPPALDPIGNKSVNENELLEFTVSASDVDGDTLTYSASDLPSGATFDVSTQTFSWTPNHEQSGNHDITFTVSDGSSTDSETVTITVSEIDAPPDNNAPIAKIISITPNPAKEDEAIIFSGTGEDLDENDSITAYSWRSNRDGALSSQANFSKNNLSAGIHTIYLKVKDKYDVWSNEVSLSLTINTASTPPSITNVIRAKNNYKVYEIIEGKKHWLPTPQIFERKGYKWENISVISDSEVSNYPRAKLLRAQGDKKVYYLTESGMVRHIPTAQVFESYSNKWEDIIEVSADELNTYEPNRLIRLKNGFKVYLLENGKKRWIKTAEIFNARKYDWLKIAPVNQIELNAYSEGAIIEQN